jgi:dienelactone hydrolase
VATAVQVQREAGSTQSHVEFTRCRSAGGIEGETIEGDGYRATLWAAAGGATIGNVVWLGGAAGGHPQIPGALLASRGVTAMAVAYFGAQGLPATLNGVPVEVVVRAAHDLGRRSKLIEAPIVVGVSRGSELALHAAAHYPNDCSRVVGIAPAGRVHGLSGSTLDNPQHLAGRALDARGDHAHPLDEHVCYPGAGHTFFGDPGLPVADPADGRHPKTGRPLNVGGTRYANAVAAQQAWEKLVGFIRCTVGDAAS